MQGFLTETSPEPRHPRLGGIRREAEPGRAQNELARDSYSNIHLLMVAGIVLIAYGMKVTIGHHAGTYPRLAIVLLFLVPVATAVPALVSLALALLLIWLMIAYEHRGYGPNRQELRREANSV